MAFSSSSSALSCTPNITPLIDVLLVLLIIFVVIVPVSPHGLDSLIPAPPGSIASTPQLSPIVLEVLPSQTGRGIIYRLNGRPMDSLQLRASLRERSAEGIDLPLFIGGDPSLDYQAIASVVGEAKADGFGVIGLWPRHRK